MENKDEIRDFPDGEKTTGYDADAKVGEAHRRRSSVVNADVLTGELFDPRYETTQRGLKSR